MSEIILKNISKEYIDARFNAVDIKFDAFSQQIQNFIEQLNIKLDRIDVTDNKINKLIEVVEKQKEEISNLRFNIQQDKNYLEKRIENLESEVKFKFNSCPINSVKKEVEIIRDDTRFSRVVFKNAIFSSLFVIMITSIFLILFSIFGFDGVIKFLNLLK